MTPSGRGRRSMSQHWERAGIRWATVLLAFVACACAGAQWESFQTAGNYQPPTRLTVQIVAAPAIVREEGIHDAMDDLAYATIDELQQRDIEATLWMVLTPPPPPAIVIVVQGWDPGDRGLRWLCGGFGCGEGTALVVFDVWRVGPDYRAMTGSVHGWVRGGTWGGEASKSVKAAARAIACAVAEPGNVASGECGG